MEVLYEGTFNSASTFTVTHNQGLEYVGINIVINNERRPDLITSVIPDVNNPTNVFTVFLSGIYSGEYQVLVSDQLHVNPESCSDIAHAHNIMKQENVSPLTGSDTAVSGTKLFIIDTTRTSKNLSIEQTILTFGRNSVNTNAWLKNDAKGSEGYVMPYNGTIIAATAMVEDCKTQTRNFSIYTSTTEHANILTVSGSNLQTAVNSAVDIDFVAGDYIKVRGRGPDGKINDVAVSLWLKWRV